MKGAYVSLLVAAVAVLAISVNSASLEGPQSDCPDICTFDYNPVCGFDDTCYQVYGNDCTMRSDRCKTKHHLRTVAMELCDEAAKESNPKVVACKTE